MNQYETLTNVKYKNAKYLEYANEFLVDSLI